MSKRYTTREDLYIVAYFGCVADWQLATDLERHEGSIRARAKKLKETGAWDALVRVRRAQMDYLACLGFDENDQIIATIAT